MKNKDIIKEIFELCNNPELIKDLQLIYKDSWWVELNIIMLIEYRARAYPKSYVKMY